ncbi:thiaminase II [Clostridium senegalense]|uniref:thiaminase II n=1 Tax=Clostridium senegalense TaxID=1465809 RepID=UPI001C10B191|nr:thiaminase II [Clostridium senegalense]MBU5225930.1 thiaminase II [Clostridium senegalense]
MKFTDYLYSSSKEIWEGYKEHPFICNLAKGTLDKNKFMKYLIQDYLYLKEYAKVFCVGVVKADTMEEMKFFYSSTKGTMEDETAVHIKYLTDHGYKIEDVEKMEYNIATINYTSYMKSIALTGNIKEIAIATLPCTWSYNYIGKYLLENYKDNLEKNFYRPWIEEYSSKDFNDFTDVWLEYVNKICNDLNEKEKERLKDIFVKCSLYEMEFWNMANQDM